jgi:large subunit ribosomal protein L18
MRLIMRKWAARERRKKRVRKRVFGTPERPRLAVRRSLKHIYAQVVDDTTGCTLVSASTVCPDLRQPLKQTGNRAAAEVVGARLAALALEKGIQKVCFDRGPFKYHGRVKALADAARKAGLQF